MNSVVKWVLILIGAIIGLNALTTGYLMFGDLGRHKELVEKVLTDAIGHDVKINGEFTMDGGATTSLSAENVQVSSIDGADEPLFVSASRFALKVDTWSLKNPVLTIQSFELKDLTYKVGDVEFVLDGVASGGLDVAHSGERGLNLRLVSDAIRFQQQDDGNGQRATELDRLFSDEPFDVAGLDDVDVTLDIKIGELVYGKHTVNDLVVDAALLDGRVDIDKLKFASNGGEVSIDVSVRPAADGLSVDGRLAIDDLRLGSLWSEEAGIESLPSTSGTFALQGQGESMQQLMMAATGELKFSQGPGRLKEIAASGLFGDVVVQVLQTLNPLSSEQPYTSLECGYYEVTIADGIAEVTDLRVQTDDMMLVGDGEITLQDEALQLSVRAKPREGFGISLGGVANSFVKLGGTLTQPELQLDAAAGATTTGAAMATGGLSLVARGLWDRVSAANDICVATESSISVQ